MFNKLQSVLSTNTVRQSIITSAATFMSSGLGAVYYLLLAKALGPEDYGLFSLAMSILLVGVSVADLGIGQGLVRFVGRNKENNKYLPYVNISGKAKLVSGLLAILVLTFFAGPIASLVFHQPKLAPLLPVAGIGVFAQLFFFLSIGVFQGLQQFLLWGGIQVGTNFIRLVLFLIIMLSSGVNASISMIIFVGSYMLGAVVSLKWVDKGWLKAKTTSVQWSEFWKFNRWTAAFSILASITARLDVVISGRYLSLQEVGVYSLATAMSAFLPQLATAIGAVTTAKFASIKNGGDEKKYLKKAMLFVFGISVAVALLLIPVALLVAKFAGAGYAESIIPFVILLLALIIFISTNPIRDSILYFYGRPKFFFWMTVGQALVIGVVGYLIVPRIGIIGSALTVLVSQIYVAIASLAYYFSLNKTKINK